MLYRDLRGFYSNIRIFVIGGTGFMGHNIAIYLYEKGFDIIVIDNFERAFSLVLGGEA